MAAHKPFISLMTAAVLLMLAAVMAHAQRASQDRAALAGPVTLANDAEVRRHFSRLEQARRRANSDELAVLYDEYRAGLNALSAENAELYGSLLEENRAAHAALRDQQLDGPARAVGTREIQESYAAATAERQASYTDAQQALAERYASDRAAARAALDGDISTLNEQLSAALAELRGGAGSVAVPAALPPGGRAGSGRLDAVGEEVGIVTPNC